MSKRSRKRAKQLAAVKWPRTQVGWLKRWKNRFERIRLNATTLSAERLDYLEFGKIVTASPNLDKTAGFLHLVKRMYLSHLSVAIRTFDDDDLRSVSLYNLIEEIRDNCSQLRQREKKRRIRGDLSKLKELCKKVRQHVNKHVAHDAARKPIKSLTYQEMDAALDGIYLLINRYNRLLFNGTEWGEPSVIPSRHIFTHAWIERDTAI
jgi:hypothetical protein